ncbi:MAG: MBOAT family O-acyltransferase, partial [Polyangiales bacterium]
GYTDIARGLARIIGIRLCQNFNWPYLSLSIRDFWRRWHMSLSSWLGDYVFAPTRMALRGFGNVGLVVAVAANFVLIGAWHGLRWTFVVFGAVHAIFTIVSVFTLKKRDVWFARRPAWARVRSVAGRVWLFEMVASSMALFRAATLGDAWSVLRAWPRGVLSWFAHPVGAMSAFATEVLKVVGMGPLGFYRDLAAVAVLVAIHTVSADERRQASFERLPKLARWGAYYVIVLSVLRFGVLEARTFFYAQF